jgi:hypothetical protein
MNIKKRRIIDMKFRKLNANEVDVRVNIVKENGLGLLLYKDARVDQNILDETVGSMNWQRDHKEIKGNVYGGIGIYNQELGLWVWKWDAGVESNTEAVKGEASDSFKRAGFNWGIGRELYTAPFIWIKKGLFNDKYDKFSVTKIGYDENGNINELSIYNETIKKVVFEMDKATKTVIEESPLIKKAKDLIAEKDYQNLFNYYNVNSWEELTEAQLEDIIKKKGGKV